ncbi:suppressor of lurcher protein 1-like isoform X2 [Chironomus tepperi]|uniref:suppressor of lurcher protein 1-like isoform X2 n=1 Tax=Chironomus tepperi TaxID=113505 RepID=UPI00391F1CAD
MTKKAQLILNLLLMLIVDVELGVAGECEKDKIKNCNKIFNSIDQSDGIITSPCYPSNYPNETVCKFEFIGRTNERIQLNFIDFSLTGNHTECYYSDTVELFMFIKDKYQPVQLLCGLHRLPGPILSYNNKMKIEFRGIYGGKLENARGFKLEFAFIRNYGIKSGKQIDDKCDFIYNSNETKIGVINSPNFPGIYPINIECNYYFHGVFPCYGDDVSSDSVEFSNFPSRDRKLKFYCGKVNHSFKLKSDNKYFRVTFRSNDKLDGTGFRATYKFIGPDKIENRTQYIEINIKNSTIKLNNSFLLIFIVKIVKFYSS